MSIGNKEKRNKHNLQEVFGGEKESTRNTESTQAELDMALEMAEVKELQKKMTAEKLHQAYQALKKKAENEKNQAEILKAAEKAAENSKTAFDFIKKAAELLSPLMSPKLLANTITIFTLLFSACGPVNANQEYENPGQEEAAETVVLEEGLEEPLNLITPNQEENMLADGDDPEAKQTEEAFLSQEEIYQDLKAGAEQQNLIFNEANYQNLARFLEEKKVLSLVSPKETVIHSNGTPVVFLREPSIYGDKGAAFTIGKNGELLTASIGLDQEIIVDANYLLVRIDLLTGQKEYLDSVKFTWETEANASKLSETPGYVESVVAAEFNAEIAGFHNFYEIKVSSENGQTVARSIYDSADSPHYTFNAETQAWVDNHPGRNDIELLFPPVRDSGRSIWKEFQGYEWQEDAKSYIENEENKTEWNQDMLAYEYVNAEHDEGHPVFFSMMMDYDKEGLKDEDMGKVNFAERNQAKDFILGESGLKIDFFIAANHPHVEHWEFIPKELSNKLFIDMYLKQHPNLKGKHLIVRIVEENLTSQSDILNSHRETFFEQKMAKIVNTYNTGYIENISPNIDLVTLSIGDKEIEGIRAAIGPSIALLYTIYIQENYTFNWDKFETDRNAHLETINKIIIDSGAINNPEEVIRVKLK